MHVSAVVIIDPTKGSRPFTYARFMEHVAGRLQFMPQFRWRLVEVPLGLDRPVFVEDPDFDLEAHVHRVGVPAPGGKEQLGNLVGELISLKLDRRRPLWEFWLIEGLEGGKVALLAKVHHAIVDGVSGTELATILMDAEPDPPESPPEPERVVEPMPDGLELLARGVANTMFTPWRVAKFGMQTVRQGVRFVPFVQRTATPPVPFQAPRTSFNDAISPNRRFAYTSVSLDTVKAIRRATDTKVNDIVLAICGGSLRRYLLEGDELPGSPLIAQVPVSLRADDDKTSVGTKVAAMFASLATNIDDPLERLLAIHESTQGAKEMQKALAAEKIMGISETTPPGMINLAARMYTATGLDRTVPPIMNLIISNVPGPPFPLYCAGAPIDALYPMGPLLYGTGINITVFSYRDSVDFGFMTCRELVPEPWRLVDGVHEALAELADAIGV